LAISPASAQPSLLWEFSDTITAVEFGDPLPTRVDFDFDAYDPNFSLSYVDWRDDYNPSDVGMTFIAPTDVIQGANRAIASPTSKYLLETGPANFSSERSFYLPGYRVTSVERDVDELVITRTQGDLYFLEAAQTIRFWGEPIPEPASMAMLVVAIECLALVDIAIRLRHLPNK
jgi:hypothetical protein